MKKPKQQEVSLADLARAAMYEAAKDVILRAKEAETPIIIWKDGKIKRINPHRFRLPPKRAKRSPAKQG